MSSGMDELVSTPPTTDTDDYDSSTPALQRMSSTDTDDSSTTIPALQRMSSQDLTSELEQIWTELQSELLLAGCASRTKTRMELILISSMHGKSSLEHHDAIFCEQLLPLVVHVLFQRTTFPSSFSATHCNLFFQQVITFSITMERSIEGDELLNVGLLLLGSDNVELPPFVAAKTAADAADAAAAVSTTSATTFSTTTFSSSAYKPPPPPPPPLPHAHGHAPHPIRKYTIRKL